MAGTDVTLLPLEPRGCRYFEIHAVIDDAVASVADVSLVSVSIMARAYYHTRPLGTFGCALGLGLVLSTFPEFVEDFPSAVPCASRSISG